MTALENQRELLAKNDLMQIDNFGNDNIYIYDRKSETLENN